MTNAQFSLTWDEYKKNICNGLSSLQQNGDFVDMTLAADGHFVKVHQVIIALTSPYIRNLIKSADCSHPVIFLNKISYTTLSSILEYIYTGEVIVAVENLNEFIEAGKELHIKGLEDMKFHQNLVKPQAYKNTHAVDLDETMENINYLEVSNEEKIEASQSDLDFDNGILMAEPISVIVENTYDEELVDDAIVDESINESNKYNSMEEDMEDHNKTSNFKTIDTKNVKIMQYTVSNQGSLQMILNRFVYYLKYTNRNNTRQWRCVDYVNNIKCPAYVITKNDIVVQRISAHTHTFHDKKILKKVEAGAVFSAIQEAEKEGSAMRAKEKSTRSEK
ncbi:hypothetical protein ACJJTC_006840 [Scirpophaga incertulas]